MTETTDTPVVELAPDRERATERTSLMLTPTERKAVEFVREVHNGRMESIPDVLREFSLNDCVTFHQRAMAAATRVA